MPPLIRHCVTPSPRERGEGRSSRDAGAPSLSPPAGRGWLRSGRVRGSAGAAPYGAPLLSCRTSPPHGGRSGGRLAFANRQRCKTSDQWRCRKGSAAQTTDLPHVGEMSGRTEGARQGAAAKAGIGLRYKSAPLENNSLSLQSLARFVLLKTPRFCSHLPEQPHTPSCSLPAGTGVHTQYPGKGGAGCLDPLECAGRSGPVLNLSARCPLNKERRMGRERQG